MTDRNIANGNSEEALAQALAEWDGEPIMENFGYGPKPCVQSSGHVDMTEEEYEGVSEASLDKLGEDDFSDRRVPSLLEEAEG